ncbi:MAG: hypothetical protein QM688_05650 [Sphingomonas bacterium]
MAVLLVATVVCGFSLNFASGRVSVAMLPIQVHLHGMAFGGWTLLYLVQSWLVDKGSVALHRRLGWLGAALTTAMIPLGIAVTAMAIQRGAVPFFFPTNIFLVLNIAGVVLFGALVAAAIGFRRRADWHPRLMHCAAVNLIAPAFGRLLPMPLLGPWGPLGILGMIVLYIGMGALFDLVVRRSVHRAWWWGLGATIAVNLAVVPIAGTAPVRALTGFLAKGRSGGQVAPIRVQSAKKGNGDAPVRSRHSRTKWA